MKAGAPHHIGIIMDGNRRWAKSKGLPSTQGHQRGYSILKELALYLILERRVPFVSAYAFSMENWSRTKGEVGFLMKLVTKALRESLTDFQEAGIRILIMGSRQNLDSDVIAAVERAENETRSNDKGTLAICFNYGGQQEIVDASRNMASAGLLPEQITIERFGDFIYHPEVPPLDLIIRTSGEQRLSGYMLWRAAYAELIFIDKYWPDITNDDIDDSINQYAARQRRHGR